MLTQHYSTKNSTAFLDYRSIIDVNDLAFLRVPFIGRVDTVLNGPNLSSNNTLVINAVNESNYEGKQESLKVTQLVISNTGVFIRQCENLIMSSWVTYSPSNSQLLSLYNSVAFLEKAVAELKITDPVTPVYDDSHKVIDVTGDAILKGTSEVSGSSSITAKSLNASNISITNGIFITNVTEDATLSNFRLLGDVSSRQYGNAQVVINSKGFVRITNSTFNQKGYNAIEIGNNSNAVKNIMIEGVNFSSNLSNNAISIHNMEDEGEIIVTNCHFTDVSNVLRYSNPNLIKATIKFQYCTFEKWDSGEWAGCVVCQDNHSTSTEQFLSDRPFSPDKLTVEFNNCIGPNGAISKVENISSICGTFEPNQLLYVFCNKATPSKISYNRALYPNIVFK